MVNIVYYLYFCVIYFFVAYLFLFIFIFFVHFLLGKKCPETLGSASFFVPHAKEHTTCLVRTSKL